MLYWRGSECDRCVDIAANWAADTGGNCYRPGQGRRCILNTAAPHTKRKGRKARGRRNKKARLFIRADNTCVSLIGSYAKDVSSYKSVAFAGERGEGEQGGRRREYGMVVVTARVGTYAYTVCCRATLVHGSAKSVASCANPARVSSWNLC